MIIITRNAIFLSVFFLMQLIHSGSFAEDQRYQLDINLSKNIYLLHEPIWLDVTLTNISDDTTRIVRLAPPNQGGVGIELRNSLGNEMPYTGPSILLAPRKGFLLDANEQYYDSFDLLELFSTYLNPRCILCTYYCGLLPVGSYTVQARYRKAKSQELIFKVVEPAEEEKEALQLLINGFTLQSKKKFDLGNKIFQEIVNKYPNSVYAAKAFKESFQYSEFLQRYPNSGYCQSSLRSLTRDFQREEKYEYLSRVVNEYPDTRAAKFAKRMLMMLKKESDKNSNDE